MGQIQTETPYYQPNPDATIPFSPVPSLNDPVFTESSTANTADAWGLRILSSSDILVYGAGLYSFFNNYNVECSQVGQGEACQNRIFSVEQSSNVELYCLNTVGTTEMITLDGVDEAVWSSNVNTFIDTVALFRSDGGL
jgi:glucan 1,3-beta-glucosidase